MPSYPEFHISGRLTERIGNLADRSVPTWAFRHREGAWRGAGRNDNLVSVDRNLRQFRPRLNTDAADQTQFWIWSGHRQTASDIHGPVIRHIEFINMGHFKRNENQPLECGSASFHSPAKLPTLGLTCREISRSPCQIHAGHENWAQSVLWCLWFHLFQLNPTLKSV